MPVGIDAFTVRMGTPAPPAEGTIRFSAEWAQGIWQYFLDAAGAGYFLDGFVYLFGRRARELDGLLLHWSFLFPDDIPRWVIGKNAYGALLVLEEPERDGTKGRVGMVDPLEVRYVTDAQLTLVSLLGRWLPQELLPRFLDDGIYRAWREREGATTLDFGQLLAIKVPLSLGGTMTPENFQVESLNAYYQTTGALYRKTLDNEGQAPR